MTLLALLPWLAIAAVPLLLRGRLSIRRYDGRPERTPLVSVIVPARDEAHNIGACVATLLDSDYANREVIVVDDGSGDGTGDIARVLAAHSNGGLRVVDGRPLPPGWGGKAWACWQGYQAAAGELLLFTDADTRHDAVLLGRAVCALQRHDADVLTLVPRYQAARFLDAAVLPHLWLGSMLRARVLGRGERAPLAANGQYLLIRRAAYESAGGHEAVRDARAEDVRLAARIASGGRQPVLAYAEAELEARPSMSVRAMVGEWTRRLGGEQPPAGIRLRVLLVVLAALVAAFWIVPPVLLLRGIFGAVSGDLLTWAIAATVISLLFWLTVHWRLRIRGAPALVYPVGAFTFAWVLLRIALRRPGPQWKGRTYPDAD